MISFRFGASHNADVYVRVCKANGEVLATFRNNAYTKDTEMVCYYYVFDNTEETSCYFEIIDNATSNYGCFVVDDFRANLESLPSGAVLGSEAVKA